MAMFNSFLYVYQMVYPSISQYYPIIIPANHPYKTILNQMVILPLAQGPGLILQRVVPLVGGVGICRGFGHEEPRLHVGHGDLVLGEPTLW